jgi:two-component system phosphate regulon response regulator PhoB
MAQPVVLVAEDDPSVQLTLRFVLEDAGFQVVVASDGEQALAVVRAAPPDAILLDFMMPKLTGLEVLNALRRDDRTATIPVMMLTGMAHSEMRALDGGVEYVSKPFSPDDLVGRLRSLVGRS